MILQMRKVEVRQKKVLPVAACESDTPRMGSENANLTSDLFCQKSSNECQNRRKRKSSNRETVVPSSSTNLRPSHPAQAPAGCSHLPQPFILFTLPAQLLQSNLPSHKIRRLLRILAVTQMGSRNDGSAQANTIAVRAESLDIPRRDPIDLSSVEWVSKQNNSFDRGEPSLAVLRRRVVNEHCALAARNTHTLVEVRNDGANREHKQKERSTYEYPDNTTLVPAQSVAACSTNRAISAFPAGSPTNPAAVAA